MKKYRPYVFILTAVLVAASLVVTGIVATKAFCSGDDGKELVIKEIVNFLKDKKVRLSEDRLERMASTLYEECKLYDLDYRLVLAIIKVESNFRSDATSSRGAKGLMQIKPSLARFIANTTGLEFKGTQDLHEPGNNIKLGTYHISKLSEDFKNIHAVLHAYNVGEKKARARVNKESEPNTPFTRRVLKEYNKNITILPDP